MPPPPRARHSHPPPAKHRLRLLHWFLVTVIKKWGISLQVLFKWSKSKLQLRVNYFRGANREREKHTELPHEGLRLNTLFKKKKSWISYIEKLLLLFMSLNICGDCATILCTNSQFIKKFALSHASDTQFWFPPSHYCHEKVHDTLNVQLFFLPMDCM